MNAQEVIAALDLPAGARVDQRVPKKLLLENGAPTTADKRYISEGIEEFSWVAALKPTTFGIPEYRDETREYLEIAILCLTLRPGAKAGRLIELVHRAIPYPVLLITQHSGRASVSAAHKRWSQGEAESTVLDGNVVDAQIGAARDESVTSAFLSALALNHQPRPSLYAFYQGWIDTLLAFQAACKTGRFVPSDSTASAVTRRQALAACARLEAEISQLSAAAAREKQMARQVALNLEMKRIEAELAAVYENL